MLVFDGGGTMNILERTHDGQDSGGWRSSREYLT